jgi:hypothetical protein
MKAILKLAFVALLAINATTGKANTESILLKPSSEAVKTTTTALTQKEADALIKRVYEIRDLDKKTLTAEQKRALRDELQTIKIRLEDPLSGGIYISIGGLILILILVIILF